MHSAGGGLTMHGSSPHVQAVTACRSVSRRSCVRQPRTGDRGTFALLARLNPMAVVRRRLSVNATDICVAVCARRATLCRSTSPGRRTLTVRNWAPVDRALVGQWPVSSERAMRHRRVESGRRCIDVGQVSRQVSDGTQQVAGATALQRGVVGVMSHAEVARGASGCPAGRAARRRRGAAGVGGLRDRRLRPRDDVDGAQLAAALRGLPTTAADPGVRFAVRRRRRDGVGRCLPRGPAPAAPSPLRCRRAPAGGLSSPTSSSTSSTSTSNDPTSEGRRPCMTTTAPAWCTPSCAPAR